MRPSPGRSRTSLRRTESEGPGLARRIAWGRFVGPDDHPMMGRTHHLAEATGAPAGGLAVPGPRRVPRSLAFLLAAILVAGATYLAPAVRDALFGAPPAPAKSLLAVPGQATAPDGRLPLPQRIA